MIKVLMEQNRSSKTDSYTPFSSAFFFPFPLYKFLYLKKVNSFVAQLSDPSTQKAKAGRTQILGLLD